MGVRLCYLVACRVLETLGSRRRTALDKDIELMVLRHEVRVLERQLHGRVRYRTANRAILAALSRLLPRWRWRCFLVTPETLLRWHRELSCGKWKRWRARRGEGRPRPTGFHLHADGAGNFHFEGALLASDLWLRTPTVSLTQRAFSRLSRAQVMRWRE